MSHDAAVKDLVVLDEGDLLEKEVQRDGYVFLGDRGLVVALNAEHYFLPVLQPREESRDRYSQRVRQSFPVLERLLVLRQQTLHKRVYIVVNLHRQQDFLEK